MLIEQAEALGEPAEDPLLLFVGALWHLGRECRWHSMATLCASLRRSFWRLPRNRERQSRSMVGHSVMGVSLMFTRAIWSRKSRSHFDRAIALYDPVQHRALAACFGQDPGAAILAFRSLAQWLLGYAEGAAALPIKRLKLREIAAKPAR